MAKYRNDSPEKKNGLSSCISDETCKYLQLCIESAKNSTEKKEVSNSCQQKEQRSSTLFMSLTASRNLPPSLMNL